VSGVGDDEQRRDARGAAIEPDQTAQLRSARIDELLKLADAAGLTYLDFDEVVIDLCDRDAADLYNAGSYAQLDDESAHEQLHEDAGHRAAEINNGGACAQLEFLLDQLGELELRNLIVELATA